RDRGDTGVERVRTGPDEPRRPGAPGRGCRTEQPGPPRRLDPGPAAHQAGQPHAGHLDGAAAAQRAAGLPGDARHMTTEAVETADLPPEDRHDPVERRAALHGWDPELTRVWSAPP